MEATGIILAGGKSSRMGEDKAMLKINNKYLIQYAIDTFHSLDIPILIVGDEKYCQFGENVVQDIYPEKGPIGGIYTGLKSTQTEINFITACDTPFVPASLWEHLYYEERNKEALITSLNGRKHPLIGRYNSSIIATAEACIQKNELKLSSLLDQIDSEIIELSNTENFNDETLLLNLNSKEEFIAASRLIK